MDVRCDAFVACMRMPNKRRRCPAAREEPDKRLNVHPTAEVLSQKRAAWVWARLEVMHSSASQLRTIPDRSIIFMASVLDMKISFTVCGYSSCQMIDPIFLRPDVQSSPNVLFEF